MSLESWTGLFPYSPGQRIDVMWWRAAHALVVVVGNGIYIVDPLTPQDFAGFEGLTTINDLIVDESTGYLFAADRLRVHAFSPDRKPRWISEAFGGYDARFVGCGGRVVALEMTPFEDDDAREIVRLRAEDGTVLRSRFRVAQKHWRRNQAA
ncbi:MAG TPA: hypothetical protein VN519_01590 [Bryobacteraceae bacterium]|nr:hypothetical protein [Bryobacteraceae bacterium]